MFGFMGAGGFPRRWMRWFSGFGGGKFFQKLELSDEQVEKISDLKEDSFAKFAHGRIDGMQLHQQLFKELSKEKIDREKVLSIGKRMKDHKSEMTDLLVENMLGFAEILTAEQRKKLKSMGMRQFMQERCGERERFAHQHEQHREHHEHHEGHSHEEGHHCSHHHHHHHEGEEGDEMEGSSSPPPPPPPPRRGGSGYGRRH